MFDCWNPQWRVLAYPVLLLFVIAQIAGGTLTFFTPIILIVLWFFPGSTFLVQTWFATPFVLVAALINHLLHAASGKRIREIDDASALLLDEQLAILVGLTFLGGELSNRHGSAAQTRRHAAIALLLFWPAAALLAIANFGLFLCTNAIWPVYFATGLHPDWWVRFAGRIIRAIDASANFILLARMADYDLVIRHYVPPMPNVAPPPARTMRPKGTAPFPTPKRAPGIS